MAMKLCLEHVEQWERIASRWRPAFLPHLIRRLSGNACGHLSQIVINSGFRMRPDQRIVTILPLTELWDETGPLTGERIRILDGNLIRGLMGTGQVQFIVANCGAKLNWIPMQERFDFWKAIRPQVADALKPIFLERFPNQTAYIASEWRGRAGECLILLEMHH
jgi:hypothetical protein